MKHPFTLLTYSLLILLLSSMAGASTSLDISYGNDVSYLPNENSIRISETDPSVVVTKYTGQEKDNYLPVIEGSKVCLYAKLGTNATNLQELRERIDEAKNSVPEWQSGKSYIVGDLVSYDSKIYEVIQPHTSQAHWLPDAVASLYSFYAFQDLGEVPAWVQPTGGHDAYSLGNRVLFSGYIYESAIDANVWQPGVYGWTELGFLFEETGGANATLEVTTEINSTLVLPVNTTTENLDVYCTDARDKVQVGQNTIIIENQTSKSVIYEPYDDINITATVFRDIYKNGSYTTQLNDVFVFVEDNKFGANWSSDNTTWESFKYEIRSKLPIEYTGGVEFLFRQGSIGHTLNLEDICYNGANCSYSITKGENESVLELFFYNKDGFIDPTFTITSLEETGLILNNTRHEETFTHLEIDSTAERHAVFDGSGDYINIENFDVSNFEEITISFWFNNFNAPSGNEFLVSNLHTGGDDLRVQLKSNNIEVNFDDGTEDKSTIAFTDNNSWHHLLITTNGTHHLVYLDNNLEDTSANSFDFSSSTLTDLYLGGRYSLDTALNYNGSLDEVMIFNRELSTSDINNIYNLNRSDYNGSTENLKGYWSFDDYPENYEDSSGWGNDGSASGNTYTEIDNDYDNNDPYSSLIGYWSFDAENYQNYNSSCVVGSCVELDGNDYIILNETDSNPTENFTISTWININTLPTDSASRMYPVTNDLDGATSGWGLFINDAPDTFQFRANDLTTEYVDATTTLSVNQWYHVVARYNGTHLSIFVDGIQEGSSASTGSIRYDNDNAFAFGKRVGADDFEFNGLIDEFYLYDEALTDDEISTIYNRNVAGLSTNITTGLKVNIPLDGNATNIQNGADELGSVRDDSSYDLTNNDNDGSYGGGAYSGAGLYDDSLVLDGDEDYINIPNPGYPDMNTFTVSAWIYQDSATADNVRTTPIQMLRYGGATNSDGFTFTKSCAGDEAKYAFYIYDDGSEGVCTANDIEKDKWVLYTITGNGTLLSMYINGVLDNTAVQNIPIGTTTTDLEFGRGYNGALEHNGLIDEVMIFNTALNSTQISDIYNNQSNRFKSEGTVTLPQVTLDNASNQFNLTFNEIERNYNSDVSARFGLWNSSLGYNNTMDGLLAYYNFDGNANDALGNWNVTNTNGNVTNASGTYNGSYHFNLDDNSYIYTGDMTLMTSSNDDVISASVWIKSDTIDYPASPTQGGIISKANEFIFARTDEDDFTIGSYGGNIDSQSCGSITGEWQHLVFIYDEGEDIATIYVDGTQVCSATLTDNSGNSVDELQIGGHSGSGLFNGSIDEVMIFNRTLSQEEITELYVKGRANWEYTDWQVLDVNNQISNTTSSLYTNVLPEYKHTTSDQWYTSLVYNNIALSYDNFSITPPVCNDTIPPYWENNNTNITKYSDIGDTVSFNITLYDLNTSTGKYIFSFYNTTDWVNTTNTSWTNGSTVNETLILDVTDRTVKWKWYIWDDCDNLNVTEDFNATLAPPVATIEILSPANGSFNSGTSVQVILNTSSSNYDYLVYNINGTNVTAPSDTFTLDLNATATYYLTAYAVLGGESSSDSINFIFVYDESVNTEELILTYILASLMFLVLPFGMLLLFLIGVLFYRKKDNKQ